MANRRSAREDDGCFVVEGRKLLAEAIAAGANVEVVYLDAASASEADRELAELAASRGAAIRDLEAGVIDRIAPSVTPPPLLTVVQAVDISLSVLAPHRPDFVVVAVEVRDPGNAGSLLRIAGAAGAGAVVCCGGSVDVYNPKTVRASAGALFHVPVVTGVQPEQALAELRSWGLGCWAASPRGGADPGDVDLRAPFAVIFGNEARGLPPAVEELVDGALTIPMTSRTESLGVAQAAAVICFEAVRQRSAVAAPGPA